MVKLLLLKAATSATEPAAQTKDAVRQPRASCRQELAALVSMATRWL
jgi:hypothetical protein